MENSAFRQDRGCTWASPRSLPPSLRRASSHSVSVRRRAAARLPITEQRTECAYNELLHARTTPASPDPGHSIRKKFLFVLLVSFVLCPFCGKSEVCRTTFIQASGGSARANRNLGSARLCT